MTPVFTTHESRCGIKQKRTLNTPVSPWEISDTYSGLQMSVILMNTPKIWFLGIRFLRIALKSQHSLVVLSPKQAGDKSSDPWTRRDLSHPGNGNWELANAPTSPCYTILMLLMIVPCIINYLTCFVSAQVSQLQHVVPVQQRYKTTADHGKYHSPLDGHCYEDSEAWD